MTNAFAGPSETLLELRQAGRETWLRPGAASESVLSVTARVSADIEQALPGAERTQVGWAIFAIGTQAALKNESLAGCVRSAIPAEPVRRGVREAAQLLCHVGNALIDRGGEVVTAAPGPAALQVRADVVEARATLVKRADSVLAELMPSSETAATFRAVISGRGTGQGDDAGMVGMIAKALPGIDAAQAGWGLVVCGSSLLSLANDAAPAAKPRRWGRPQRRPDTDADLLGSALVGTVAVIAGDAWIGAGYFG